MIGDTVVVTSHALDVSTPASVPVLCGKFSEMYTVLFNQGGVDVVANPYIAGSWEHGGFELRALLDFNVHLRDAAAVIQATADAS